MTDLRQRISYTPILLVQLFLGVSLLGGCTARVLPPYPTQAPSSYPYHQVHDGLAIGIKLLTDSQESETYFDTDLLSRGVLAIFISAQNQQAPGTFILLKDRFTLRTAQKEEQTVNYLEQRKSSFSDTALDATVSALKGTSVVAPVVLVGGGWLTGLTLLYGASKIKSPVSSHEDNVRAKFTIEELQLKKISRGEETHGFVYFPRLSGFPGSDQLMLHLEVQNFDSKEVKVFDFVLDGR